MINVNKLNISRLQNTNYQNNFAKQSAPLKNITPALTSEAEDLWLNIRNIENEQQLSEQFSDICQRHHQQRKWILVINPEKLSLDILSHSALVDSSKILRVNTNKVKVNLKNIEKALCTGNCAAVILCNTTLAQNQMSHLANCAQNGRTPCFVLTNNTRVH